MRAGVRVLLSSGRTVEMVLPTVDGMLMAYQAGAKLQGRREQLAASMAVLKGGIRKIDDVDTSVHQLAAWPFTAAETMELTAVAGQITSPPTGAVEAVKAGAVVAVDGASSTWSLALPDGRTVVLRMLDWGACSEALCAADQEQDAALAGEYRVSLAGIKQSLVSVNGAPVTSGAKWLQDWPFDVPTTALLGAVWRTMHGLGAEAPGFTMVPTGG